MKQRTILFKGVNVSYTDEGSGTAVVFLHGFLGAKEVWNSFSKEISKAKRVITIDLLGHGKTDCLSYVHTMEEMAEAVNAVLLYLRLRKYFLIGHSLGGYVCLALAETNPDNIRGLCLFHSTAKADTPQKKIERDRVIKIVKRDPKFFVLESIPNLFNTDSKPYKRGIERTKKIALKTSKQGILGALEGMKIRLDREIVLKFAPFPVLYIIGEKDTVLLCKELIKESQSIENGSYVILKEVGHMGYIEAKKEAYKIVRQFVK